MVQTSKELMTMVRLPTTKLFTRFRREAENFALLIDPTSVATELVAGVAKLVNAEIR